MFSLHILWKLSDRTGTGRAFSIYHSFYDIHSYTNSWNDFTKSWKEENWYQSELFQVNFNSWQVWERMKSSYLLVKSMFLLQDKRLIQTPWKGSNRGVKHENQDKCDGLQNLVNRIKTEFIKNNPPSLMEFKAAPEWMTHTVWLFF